jgi:protein N-terminal amidase
MDLNPQSPSWTIDGGPYELADHCTKTGSGLLILLNAWLDSEEEMDEDIDISTMNYWATLLRPLWYRMGNNGGSDGEENAEPQSRSEDSETIVVICNRSGTENGGAFPYTQGLENALLNVAWLTAFRNNFRRQFVTVSSSAERWASFAPG